MSVIQLRPGRKLLFPNLTLLQIRNQAPAVAWQNNGTWDNAALPFSNTPAVGAELFLTPDFASDTNWTKGAGWTIAAAAATHTAGAGTSTISQVVSVSGVWYVLVWVITAFTASTCQAQFGAIAQLNANRSTAGTFNETNRATGTASGFRANNSAQLDVFNASLKALTLNTLYNVRPGVSLPASVAATGTIILGNWCGTVYGLDSISAPTNLIQAIHDGGTGIRLEKLVAGAWVTVLTTTASYVAGQLPQIKYTGANTFQLFYNGIQRGIDQTITDAGTGLLHGVISTYIGNIITGCTVS